MSDLLSRHYADGRLDTAEFEERVGRAMAAKTRGDLAGLLEDLPPLEGQVPPTPRRHLPWVVLLVPFLMLAVVTSVATAATHVPWFLLLVGFLVWRRHGLHGSHRHHHLLEDRFH